MDPKEELRVQEVVSEDPRRLRGCAVAGPLAREQGLPEPACLPLTWAGRSLGYLTWGVPSCGLTLRDLLLAVLTFCPKTLATVVPRTLLSFRHSGP